MRSRNRYLYRKQTSSEQGRQWKVVPWQSRVQISLAASGTKAAEKEECRTGKNEPFRLKTKRPGALSFYKHTRQRCGEAIGSWHQ